MPNLSLLLFLSVSARTPERPGSARSIEGSTRQKLRHPNARHIEVMDQDRLDEGGAKNLNRPADVWTIKLSKVTPVITTTAKDATGVSAENKNEPLPTQSLNQLVFSKIQENFVEVSGRVVRTRDKTNFCRF